MLYDLAKATVFGKRIALGALVTVAVTVASQTAHASVSLADDKDLFVVKSANQSTLSILESHHDTTRTSLWYAIRRMQQRGGVVSFSGEPEKGALAGLETDPFQSLALGYAKGMPTKARPIQAAPPQSYFISVWAQGSHDHERRSASPPIRPGSVTTTSNTIVGGFDVVKIGVAQATDAIVVGAFYTHTESTGSFPASPLTTKGSTPGAGVYGSYINGGFSTDVSYVYTHTNSRFTGIAVGGQDTDSNNLAFNMQYKFDLGRDWWVEPTIGYSVTKMHNTVVNTTDGNNRRFQGGVRVGTEWTYGTVRVQPTLGGFVYSDVDVEIIHAHGTTPLGDADKGYTWGKGIGKVNVQWTDKFSTSIEGEARGRADVFGYAGRLMARYTF